MTTAHYVVAPRWVATRLTDTERAVLVSEGLLCSPAENSWLESDLAASPSHRAACLVQAVPTRATAIGETAAWVYLGGRLTWPLRLGVPHGQRPPMRLGIHKGRCLDLPEDEVRYLSGLRLLDPAGTAAEVARESEPDRARELITALCLTLGIDVMDVKDRIARQARRPGNTRAIELLAGLEPTAARA